MTAIHIESVSAPFDTQALAQRAIRFLISADAMGLLEGLDIRALTLSNFRRVVDRLAEEGVGQQARVALAASKEVDYGQVLDQLREAIELSPVPQHEWRAMSELFDAPALAQLLDVAPASLRRYRTGERETPDLVAARLHFLAGLVGDLAGAYNDVGIRRWFERPRPQLDGHPPAQWLVPGWDPNDEGPQRVRALAAALAGGGGAT
jgi:hypothetical protein